MGLKVFLVKMIDKHCPIFVYQYTSLPNVQELNFFLLLIIQIMESTPSVYKVLQSEGGLS